ncbi:MAG TPA: hypothetical protein EYG26_07410 [Planctomycetes bacterium]|nr:hypothetical protein [Planctomycetota bacterium]
MAHNPPRLDFGRLADHLADRGKLEADVLRGLLEASSAGAQPLPQALVEGGFLSDWDLAKSVCEAFNLAFVPVDVVKPDVALLELFDPKVLLEHDLVPLARFGAMVTMIMPGLVQADTLGSIAAVSDFLIQPVVGTVQGNQAWLAQHLAVKEEVSGDWGSLFDQGDAAVNAALDPTGEELSLEAPPDLLPEVGQAPSGPSRAQLLSDEDFDLPPAPQFDERQRKPQ